MKIGKFDLGENAVIAAPMEDITNPPFRSICKSYGADLMFTEFISSDGLIHDAFKSKQKLDISDNERPIGIQIFGKDVESVVLAAKIAQEANPDLIDINYGCPVKKVVNKGSGSAMLKTIPLMLEITKAVVNAVNIPVTVKTRLGWDQESKVITKIAEPLQDCGIKALTIHGRTRSQLYKGIADWTMIGEVKNNPRINIPIIGNGDIYTPFDAAEKFERYGVDGIMVARGMIGNPWIFRDIKTYLKNKEILPPPDINERVEVCKKHLDLSIQWKGDKIGIFEMRKHYAKYFKGIPNFKPYRIRLVTAMTQKEIFDILNEINC